MKTATVWRERLFLKHSGRAEKAGIVLAITSILVVLPSVVLIVLWLFAGFSLSALLSLLSFPLGFLVLVFLVYMYHSFYVAWYRYNSKLRRNGKNDIEPVVFLVKKFPWLLLGRRNF